MSTTRHSRASASGTLRNMAEATPVPCAASISAFITPRSVGLNHSTMMDAVAGSRMAPPRPNVILRGSSVAMSVVRGVSTPADMRRPLRRTARLVPSRGGYDAARYQTERERQEDQHHEEADRASRYAVILNDDGKERRGREQVEANGNMQG